MLTMKLGCTLYGQMRGTDRPEIGYRERIVALERGSMEQVGTQSHRSRLSELLAIVYRVLRTHRFIPHM